MAEPVRVLVLGGTAEGIELADRLTAFEHLAVTYSLAGRTTRPRTGVAAHRCGGFGGVEGLRRFLLDTGTAVVVDATHPFAARMSEHAFSACTGTACSLLQLVRPPWAAAAGERWTVVADGAGAASALPALGRRVFLTTGGSGLTAYAGLEDTWFLVRCIEPPRQPVPLSRHRLVLDRGPFDVASEEALMREHGIEVLVSKNAGGPLVAAKLVAARRLAIPVVMIARPAPPDAARVGDVSSAVAWVLGRHPE